MNELFVLHMDYGERHAWRKAPSLGIRDWVLPFNDGTLDSILKVFVSGELNVPSKMQFP